MVKIPGRRDQAEQQMEPATAIEGPVAPAFLEGATLPPRQALNMAAEGKVAVDQDSLAALLAGLVLENDVRGRAVGLRVDELLELVFSASAGDKFDPAAALDLVERLGRLHRGQQAELRRTVDLLVRISRPARPRVTIQAAGKQVNVATTQQVVGSIDLGDRDCR